MPFWFIHTKPILEGRFLWGQQVLQLPCPGSAEATRCDMQARNMVLFLNACGHRRSELSPPGLFRASFRYKIAELRSIWTNVRELRHFLWKASAAKCFIAFSWWWLLYNINYLSLVYFPNVAFDCVAPQTVEMEVVCYCIHLCLRAKAGLTPVGLSEFKCFSVS